MKAIIVTPGQKESIHMRDVPDPPLGSDQVAIRMIRVGLCGTDEEINHGLYGQAPKGADYLILGHENFGVVEAIGKNVSGFEAGDFVVSTVRRPCGVEILSKVVDGVSSGGFLSDAIDEGHAIDDLDDQLSPVQCSPLFLRGQRQLEDHR